MLCSMPRIFMYMHTHTHILHTCTLIGIHIGKLIHIPLYKYAYRNIHINRHTHTYTHAHTPLCLEWSLVIFLSIPSLTSLRRHSQRKMHVSFAFIVIVVRDLQNHPQAQLFNKSTYRTQKSCYTQRYCLFQ